MRVIDPVVTSEHEVRRGGLVRLLAAGALYAAMFLAFMLAPPSARPTLGPYVPMTGMAIILFGATGMHRLLWRGRAASDQLFSIGRGLLSLGLAFACAVALSMIVGLGVGVVHGFSRVGGGAHQEPRNSQR